VAAGAPQSEEQREDLPEPDPQTEGPDLLGLVGKLPVATNELTRRARVQAQLLVRKQVPGGARYAFRIDVTSMFLAGLYTGSIFPFYLLIARRDLHASASALALMTAAPFIGNLLAMLWAKAMEGKPKIPFVKWSHLVARGSVLFMALARSAWPFAFVISTSQIIGTVATPAYAAVIKDVYPDSQRGRIFGLTRVSILIAQVLTSLLVGWLITSGNVSYRVIFPIGAVFGMVAALVFSRINPNEEVPQAELDLAEKNEGSGSVLDRIRGTASFIAGTFGILKDDSAYRWFALSVFTYGFGNLLTVPIIPIVQNDLLNINPAQLSILFNIMQGVMIVAYFYWGRFVDMRSPQQAVVINIFLTTLIPVTYLVSAAVPGANYWVLLPAYLVSGIVGPGIDISYFSAILSFSGPENVGRYQALQSFLLGIRGTIAPFIGSAMAAALKASGHDLRWSFAVGIVFMCGGAWMQRVAMRRQEAHRRLMDAG
jgi:hypothetical protein